MTVTLDLPRPSGPCADERVVPLSRRAASSPTGMPYVLGLYSSGGGGHVSALDSIEACLQRNIDVRRVAPLREMLHRIDPVARLTGGRFDAELLFNHLAERGHTQLLAWLEKVGTRRVHTQRRAMARLIRTAISDHPPALIVSTMPFINAAVSDVAAAMDIPFVIVPTDHDLTNFVAGLQHPLPNRQYVLHAFAEQQQQFPGVPVGYPLRASFAQPVSGARYQKLRQARNIAMGARVVVISMGSAGGRRALELAHRLAADRPHQGYHLIICCGRNRKLAEQARATRLRGVNIDVAGYTTDMAGLLGAADVLISKPGGGTVMEALALGIPLVLDNAVPCVPWELANMRFAEQRGACVLEHTREIASLIDWALAQPRTYRAAAHFPDFQTGFHAFIEALLSEKLLSR